MNVETLDEFTARHGEYVDAGDSWRYFANGAAAMNDSFGRLTARREPPNDPIELLRLRRVFINTKLNVERSNWERFAADVREQALNAFRWPQSCPPAPADAVQRLEAGKQRILALEKQLNAIDLQLARTPEAVARADHYRLKADEQKRLKIQLDSILAVTLDS